MCYTRGQEQGRCHWNEIIGLVVRVHSGTDASNTDAAIRRSRECHEEITPWGTKGFTNLRGSAWGFTSRLQQAAAAAESDTHALVKEGSGGSDEGVECGTEHTDCEGNAYWHAVYRP